MSIRTILASKLRDTEVIGSNGKKIGNLFDISIDEKSGRILGIIVTPRGEDIIQIFQTDKNNNIVIAYSMITSFSEFIVIDERRLPRRAQKSQ